MIAWSSAYVVCTSCQLVITTGRAVVDGEPVAAISFDDLAKGREGSLGRGSMVSLRINSPRACTSLRYVVRTIRAAILRRCRLAAKL